MMKVLTVNHKKELEIFYWNEWNSSFKRYRIDSQSDDGQAGVCVFVAAEDAEGGEEEGDDGEVDGGDDQSPGSGQQSRRPELSLGHVARHLQPEHADQNSKRFPDWVKLVNVLTVEKFYRN